MYVFMPRRGTNSEPLVPMLQYDPIVVETNFCIVWDYMGNAGFNKNNLVTWNDKTHPKRRGKYGRLYPFAYSGQCRSKEIEQLLRREC